MVAVAVVALVSFVMRFVDPFRGREELYRKYAQDWSNTEDLYRPGTRLIIDYGNYREEWTPQRMEAARRRAHALRLKYEAAARTPWMPIDPD